MLWWLDDGDGVFGEKHGCGCGHLVDADDDDDDDDGQGNAKIDVDVEADRCFAVVARLEHFTISMLVGELFVEATREHRS